MIDGKKEGTGTPCPHTSMGDCDAASSLPKCDRKYGCKSASKKKHLLIGNSFLYKILIEFLQR